MGFDFDGINFESQFKALFDTFPLHQFSKLNNFIRLFWFLGENLSIFVSPAGKLNNLYYRNS